MTDFRYKAFISYSHRDERWAAWLHRSLESYRVPRQLVGRAAGFGRIPARISPVFRDRDELSLASDLSATVKQALAESENLVVICSPAATESRWVQEEIREFTRLGRSDRIFCVIVDGESSSTGSVSALFPPAIADTGLNEPLAADVRKWADGKQLAKLKLIAGMLGLPLDHLRRRELQKRNRKWALSALAGMAVVTIAFMAIMAQLSTQQRRNMGELLVADKLNELRTLLNVARDPEALNRLNEWDSADLETLISTSGFDNDSLAGAAIALKDEGMDLFDNGELSSAMEKFHSYWALEAELYRRDQNNRGAFFELGQAEFWIGYVYRKQGQFDEAEAACLAYAEITRRLIVREPENAEWVMEMAYSLSNLGDIGKLTGKLDPERTLQLMQSALDYNRAALVLDPDSDNYRSELGQSHGNLADAQLNVCDLEGALISRSRQLEEERAMHGADSDNPLRRQRLAEALTGHAFVLESLGRNDEALAEHLESLQLLQQNIDDQWSLARSQRLIVERRGFVAWLQAMDGHVEEAWAGADGLINDWNDIVQNVDAGNVDVKRFYYHFATNRAWIAHLLGEAVLAENLLAGIMPGILMEMEVRPGNRNLENLLTLAAFRYWEITGKQPPDEVAALLPEYSHEQGRIRSCFDANRAVRKSVMNGDPESAADLVTYLLDSGFEQTNFMGVCGKYYSCSSR